MNMAKQTCGSQIYFIFFHVVVLSYLMTISSCLLFFPPKLLLNYYRFYIKIQVENVEA